MQVRVYLKLIFHVSSHLGGDMPPKAPDDTIGALKLYSIIRISKTIRDYKRSLSYEP